jgi:hypothetical protein
MKITKTMLRGETIIYRTILKYELSIERVA